jgi:hypothetical protein
MMHDRGRKEGWSFEQGIPGRSLKIKQRVLGAGYILHSTKQDTAMTKIINSTCLPRDVFHLIDQRDLALRQRTGLSPL